MTDRIADLSDRARWFLNNFDEIDLADICAAHEASNHTREAALTRVRALATRLEEFAENALKDDDRKLYKALATDLRNQIAGPAAEPAATAADTRYAQAIADVQSSGPAAGHNDGPTVAECTEADRRWDCEKEGS